jgi:hypothetical protein
MAFTIIDQGSFTSAGVGKKINLPSSADYFKVMNLTQLATTQATGRGVMFEWYKDLVPADNAIEWLKTNSTNAMNLDLVTSGGFTYVESSPVVEAQAAAAITAITQANGAVVSQVNSYSEGDFLRIYNVTGMLQISGMVFQISSVSGAGYTLNGLNSSGFAAAATAGNTRRISKAAAVEPQFLYVTAISQAAQAVVTFSIDPSLYYAVGMKMYFSVPSSFGMVEMNSLTGTILSVDSANYQVTVDINSSAFAAFAFPASTASPTARLWAVAAPAGVQTSFDPNTLVQTGYNFSLQPFRSGEFVPYMFMAAGAQSPAGSLNDVIVWQAFKQE